MVAREEILRQLAQSHTPKACHEFSFFGASETAISARLRELARKGLVIGKRREGRAFKEWYLVPDFGIGPDTQEA